MPVWKANKARQSKDAIVLDLGDLSRQAERLREAAEQRAREILDQAHAEAKQLIDSAEAKGLEQGYAAGYEQGLEQGRADGRTEAIEQMQTQLKQVSAGWSQALEAWEQQREQMHREARTAVLDLALSMAEKIVHRTVETDPEVVVDQVGAALGYILSSAEATIRVHPEDRALVEEALPELGKRFTQLEHIAVVEDESVGRGGCVVQYGQGEIDATVQKQLDRIVSALKPGAEKAGEEAVAAEEAEETTDAHGCTPSDGGAENEPFSASDP